MVISPIPAYAMKHLYRVFVARDCVRTGTSEIPVNGDLVKSSLSFILSRNNTKDTHFSNDHNARIGAWGDDLLWQNYATCFQLPFLHWFEPIGKPCNCAPKRVEASFVRHGDRDHKAEEEGNVGRACRGSGHIYRPCEPQKGHGIKSFAGVGVFRIAFVCSTPEHHQPAAVL